MISLYLHDVENVKTSVYLLEETQTYTRKLVIETKDGKVEISLFSSKSGNLDVEVDEQ